jgi:hypothetical protein
MERRKEKGRPRLGAGCEELSFRWPYFVLLSNTNCIHVRSGGEKCKTKEKPFLFLRFLKLKASIREEKEDRALIVALRGILGGSL